MLTDFLAAPERTSPTAGYITMAIVGGVLALGYAVACWVWPFRCCRRCKGAGRHLAQWGGKAWRPCRRCRGTGARVRTGRRIFNHFYAKRNGS